MPTVATADSYTLQTIDGVASLVMAHGVSRWSEPLPGARSSTDESVAMRMTGRQFRVIVDVFEASRPDAVVSLALHPKAGALVLTVGECFVRTGATRVDARPAKPVPKPLPGVEPYDRFDALQEGLELITRVQRSTAELPKGIEAMMPELIAPLAEIDTLAALVQKRIEGAMADENAEAMSLR